MKNFRKTSLKFLFLTFTFLICNSDLRAQIFPTYQLKVKNLTYGTINFPDDAIYFDITITHKNGNETIFEYTGGQFFLEFNPAILTGNWPPASGNDTSEYSYKILASDFLNPFVPRSPQIYGDQANQLRLAININLGGSVDITNGVDVRIVRMRIWNKTGSLNKVPLGLQWRNEYPNPRTRVFGYVGTAQTDITIPLAHTIEPSGNQFLDGQLFVYPVDNLTNAPANLSLVWNRWPNTELYKAQLSHSNIFTGYLLNDSTRTDTSYRVWGLDCLTPYYWKIIVKDSSGRYYYPTPWKFTTGIRDTMRMRLKVSFEGKYNTLTEQLNSRDSVTLYLREFTAPHAIVDSAAGIIDSVTFSNLFEFPLRTTGDFYLVVKHRQCIETWSRINGVTLFGECATNLYDFTLLATLAYGNNQIFKGTKYCIFSGDLNNDGFIDGADEMMVINDMYNFLTGDLITDLNGDRIVDSSDLQIVDNNAYSYVRMLRPTSP